MKTKRRFRFPPVDTVLSASILCAIAFLAASFAFGPAVLAVLR